MHGHFIDRNVFFIAQGGVSQLTCKHRRKHAATEAFEKLPAQRRFLQLPPASIYTYTVDALRAVHPALPTRMFFPVQPKGYDPATKDYTIYMGRDKHENEELLKHALPLDVWFHVDDLSSAHVYLRLPKGQDLKDIPAETLEDCCQLVKANSIQGNKVDNLSIVYTLVSNLKKTASMEVGQVGFRDYKAVLKTKVEERVNAIVNRLNGTKRDVPHPDLAGEREAYEKEVRQAKKAEVQAQKKAEKSAREAAEREKDLRSYKHIMQEEAMVSSKDIAEKYKDFKEYEDDFM